MEKLNFGFTLVEGTPCIDIRQRKAAFTLAEVLITLAIVGVVAAMTIPTLAARINNKVTENQNKVFQAKLIKALNLTKTAGELNNTYTSTEDFLRNGLAKHYKMSAICSKDDLRSCVPYDTIKYMSGEEKRTINISDLKTARSIKVKDEGFSETASFVSADGIPVIITYNKNCTVDTEELDKDLSSCVAGIYDLNGSKLPNKYGITLNDDGKTIKAFTSDIRSFNGAGIGETKLFSFEIVAKLFKPKDYFTDFGSPKFYNPAEDPNYDTHDVPNLWKVANDYCESKGGKLPNSTQFAEIAQVLYNDKSITPQSESIPENKYTYESGRWNTNKEAVFEELGIPSNRGGVTLVGQYHSGWCCSTQFYGNRNMIYTGSGCGMYLSYPDMEAICVK